MWVPSIWGSVLAEDPRSSVMTDHQHDQSVTSVSHWAWDGRCGRPAQRLAGELPSTKGVDIFRSKGILAIAGRKISTSSRAHMLFDGTEGRPWRADETRTNRMVYRPSPRPHEPRGRLRPA